MNKGTFTGGLDGSGSGAGVLAGGGLDWGGLEGKGATVTALVTTAKLDPKLFDTMTLKS